MSKEKYYIFNWLSAVNCLSTTHRMNIIKFTGTTWSFVKLVILLLVLGLKEET